MNVAIAMLGSVFVFAGELSLAGYLPASVGMLALAALAILMHGLLLHPHQP